MGKKCKTCGGQLVEVGFGKYKCAWCNNEYTESDLSNKGSEQDMDIFTQLSKARNAIELEYDFSKSLNYSQNVLEKDRENQQALWLALIAENQIIYIQNDKGQYVPTFLDPMSNSIKKSRYYAKLNDDYKKSADEIEKVRLETINEFKKVKPYDVFISYKQHSSQNEEVETQEATWARDIYTELKTNPKTRNLRIFFDQKCLTDANAGWEPHIYSAIRSAKCMIILGSSVDNINSRWVKNEWKRFLALKRQGEEKEIIVLGSDEVNPRLLDESLQKKQMIKNTSGKWLDAICNQVIEVCKPQKQESEEVEKKVKKVDTFEDKERKQKIIKAVAVAAVIFLIICGIVGATLYSRITRSNEQINYVAERIDELPDYSVDDYSLYEGKILEVYGFYKELSSGQKKKLRNKDKFLTILDGFNEYTVNKLRDLMATINVESVKTTDCLKDTCKLFDNLLNEQHALLTDEEKMKLNNYSITYEVITAIDTISTDIIDKYSEVADMKIKYAALPAEYKELVYNYDLVATFDDLHDLYSKFEFSEVIGGYSIKMKEGEQIYGELEIPSRYKGENIVEIPEGAFANVKGATSIIVPDTVATIGKGAFEGCTNLESITLPFTGKSKTATQVYEAVFGFAFGYVSKLQTDLPGKDNDGFEDVSESPVAGTVSQYAVVTGGSKFFYNRRVYCYKIPATLKYVTITNQDVVPFAAFNHCTMLQKITYKNRILNRNEFAKNYVFNDCVQPTEEIDEKEFVANATEYAILPESKFYMHMSKRDLAA